MKKNIKVCYSIRENLGNALNPIIIENILGRNVIWADEYECETSAIGSGLRLFYRKPSLCKFSEEEIDRLSPCQIWSSGFLTTPSADIRPIRKLKIASVRGYLSKEILEGIYEEEFDISVGDAGLLACELIRKPQKKHNLGIIPHDRERDEVKYKELCNNTKNSIIIDVREDPLEGVKKIAECECIISSSLHGLVVADSFNIPNKLVKLTDKPLGDGFKFRDYYSVYNLGVDYIDLNKVNNIDIDSIRNDYRIDPNQVEELKKNIIKAFYKYI